MVLVIPLLAAGMYVLLDGMRGRAAAVGRLALVPYVAFYVAWVIAKPGLPELGGARSGSSIPCILGCHVC
jgi:hypothetical protein